MKFSHPTSILSREGEEVGQIGFCALFVALFLLLTATLLAPVSSHAQTLAQLIDAAKKEGALNLSWGTGTMGGIEGARAMERGFNKTYGLNFQFKYTPGPAMPQFASRIIQEARAGSRRPVIFSLDPKITSRE